jgi:SAM-dependent methyltransferase
MTQAAPDDPGWDPARYAREAGFVAELGRPLIDLLRPRPGRRILDLGCGDGRLTAELAATGAEVVACDLSAEQAAAARTRISRVQVADATALPYPADSFDGVLSNAALHWMPAQEPVLAELARVLKPGGRLAAELGAAGNVAAIVGALTGALAPRGLDVTAAYPWYFPTPEAYRALLEQAGFAVESLEHFARPTELPGGLDGWLETFARSFLAAVPATQRAEVTAELRAALAPSLQRADGSWIADYVRLRVSARRR